MSTLTLITGASNGIGLELAREFAAHKSDLILVARSKNKLQELSAELQKNFGVKTYVIDLDLARHGAALELYNRSQSLQLTPDTVINNAGFGDNGEFATSTILKVEEMMTLNMECLTLVCRYFLPAMISKKNGKIMNVASTAAFQPGPFMSVYYATKSYVLSLSEALNEELRGTGVSVTTLCPGPTWSGFQDRANVSSSMMMKAPAIMTSKEVALAGYKALQKRRGVYITGIFNRILVFSNRLAPRCVAPRIVASINRNR